MTMTNRVNELLRKRAMWAKTLRLQRHVLLCLRVEGWIFNKSIYEYPNMIFHLKHTHTSILQPSGLCPGLPGWACTRKVNPV